MHFACVSKPKANTKPAQTLPSFSPSCVSLPLGCAPFSDSTCSGGDAGPVSSVSRVFKTTARRSPIFPNFTGRGAAPPRAEARHYQKPFEEGVRSCLSAIFQARSKVLKSGVALRVNLPVATSNRFARTALNLRPFASPNPNSLFRREPQP